MWDKDKIKSGFVTFVGRPNVGKSTLLNSLLKNKISVVSSVPQTTRYAIRGILNLSDAQIVFVDSPGIHSFKDNLSQYLNVVAQKALEDVEVVVYVVDVTRKPAYEEELIMKRLVFLKAKIIMALNKIDKNKKFLNDYISLWKKEEDALKNTSKAELVYYIPISAKTGHNLDKLIEAIKENLPWGFPFYNRDTITDFPVKFRIADIIREKLFLRLKEELPHSLAVDVKEIEEKERSVYIEAYIYVNRISQKQIVIGKKGEFIKEVGVVGRREIENIFNKKVYLRLQVKVVSNWQKKIRILKELGYQTV